MKEMKHCVEKNPYTFRALSRDEYVFTFDSPEQYWEFVREWRTHYANLSKEIRDLKNQRSRENGGFVSGLWAAQREAQHEMIRRALAKDAGKRKREEKRLSRTN